VQVVIENQNAGKRLINVSAALVDPKDAAKWEVRIVRTITVPGSDSRIVNLVVNLSAGAEHRSSALVRVTARALGFADEIGVLKVRLIASVPPSHTKKDVFFHSSAQSGPTNFCFGFCGYKQWLNTLEKDPVSTASTVQMSQRSNGLQNVEFSTAFQLDTPIGTDMVLRTSDPITATLNFKSQVPVGGTAKLEMSAGDVFIGSGETPSTGNGAVQFSFIPLLEAERIKAGSVLVARITLASNQPGVAFVQIGGAARPEFVLDGSKITLPIIPDPSPKTKNAIPAGPAFLTLAVKGDAQEFVNPGKVKVFQVTVVNEGVQEDAVKIDTTKDPDRWYVVLNPGDTYRLKPGESATFGVLVKPPSGAKEGEQCHVLLNATSSADPTALAQASLTAIVTTGVDIQDESQNFTADEDTKAHANEVPAKKSPGLDTLGLLAAPLAALLMIRRRRDD
jgi:hypothetical protein